MAEQNRKIGYVLRSNARDFVAGTRVLKEEVPRFGTLVRVPTNQNLETYGIIYDIVVLDDGLVQQLATSENVDPAVIADNRVNRNVPLEINILTIGNRRNGAVVHRLPAKPPISLDEVLECNEEEVAAFTNAGRFGYLRHLLRDPDLPIAELIAAHIQQSAAANASAGRADWRQRATAELIALLRDDYQTLMQVLSALGDTMESGANQ